MRRSLLRNAIVPIDRETDILVKAYAPSLQITTLTLTGTDVIIKEEVSGTILWSCVGEGTLEYGATLSLSGSDIDLRITAKKMKTISFRYNITDVKKFRVDQKCDVYNCFAENSNLKTVTDLNVDNLDRIDRLFFNCNNLEYIEPFNIKVKAKVNAAFYGCTKINTCPILNLEVASNISDVLSYTTLNNLTNISGKALQATIVGNPFSLTALTTISDLTFSNASEVTLGNYNSVTSISNITCPVATGIYFWNNSKVVSISNITAPLATQLIFSGCGELTTVSNFTVHPNGLLNGESMFLNCSSLTSVPAFNYTNLTNGRSMFASCSSLTDFSNLNSSNLKIGDYMFNWCTGLTSLPNINYGSITQCESMFAGCTNLIGIVNISLGTVSFASSLFQGCSKITKVNLTSVNSLSINSGYISFNNAFYGCSELTEAHLFITGPTGYQLMLRSTFYNCTKLVTVTLPPDPSTGDYQETFFNCTSLTTIPTGLGSVGDFRKTFYLCSSLTEVKNRTFKSLLFSSYSQQMAGIGDMFTQSGIVTAENLTFIGGVTGGYEPNYFSVWTLFSSCPNLENVSNITIDTGGNKNVIFTINPIFSNCPKLVGRAPITVNNTGDIDHLRSYNFLDYPGIVAYNNEVNLSWAKSIVEFYYNPTIKTINFNIGTIDANTGYGGIGIAGFSGCPELESLTITNPNRYHLEGVNVYNGSWGTWMPFLENCPKLTYLRIEGLSRTALIPNTITDISMIEQILDDVVDMTNSNKQYFIIGDARKALIDPLKLTAAENKNWEIQ